MMDPPKIELIQTFYFSWHSVSIFNSSSFQGDLFVPQAQL
jgi:hypothetical protein